MNTVTDVGICTVVALYLFAAVAVDLRLLVLPSILVLGCAMALALAERRGLARP